MKGNTKRKSAKQIQAQINFKKKKNFSMSSKASFSKGHES